jgi:hypothetical protein
LNLLHPRLSPKQFLHTLAIKHQQREHPQHSSKGHRKAFYASHQKTERVVLPMGDTSSSNQDQDCKGPTQENKGAAQYHEQPAHERRRLIAATFEQLGSENEDQAKDYMKDGNASKESRYARFDVMKNGKEPQVFVVENLLWI